MSGNRGIRVNFFVINLLNCLTNGVNPSESRCRWKKKLETKRQARNSRKAKK